MLQGNSSATIPPISLVVFTGNTNLWYLKFLAPGFRHCFTFTPTGTPTATRAYENHEWLHINPLSNGTVTEIVCLSDLCDFLILASNAGDRIVIVQHRDLELLPMFPMCYTCVEATKRLIGLRAFSVVTPYQLFKKFKEHI